MRVLVTGVAGFIGAPTAKLLLERGHEVIGIDNLSSGQEGNVPSGIKLFLADFADMDIHNAISQVDACIHFAGRIEAGESMKIPARFLVENVAKTQILLESILSRGCRYFVFSSSAAVYGVDDTSTLSENSPTTPSSLYGFTKVCVEESLAWLKELRGLRFASLRYFNAAGAENNVAERHRPETHLIPTVLNSILSEGAEVSIFGNDYPTPDGTCIRDFVHVSDLARAHVLALDYLDDHESIIVNLGSGRGHSALDVIRTIEEVTGRKVRFKFVDRREGDPPYLVANIELANQLLSWQPQNSELRKIILDAWNALVPS